MPLNRKKAPPVREISSLSLPLPDIYFLDNGIPVYASNLGTQEIIRIEVVYKTGRPDENKPLAARTTAALLKEGTPTKSSADIAEFVDFYGGSLTAPIQLDTSNIVLASLNKHLGTLLPLLADILYQPAFPQQELDILVRNNQQRLQIELTKNDVIAYRRITELIFGEQNPYGYNSFPETYAALTREDLIRHHSTRYNTDNCLLFVSGNVTPDVLEALNQHLGQTVKTSHYEIFYPEPPHATPGRVKISNPDTVQTSIRIGRRLFNRKHPDYFGMFVLNTVLGGYFGSRLMTNIREDKGYTYNIYSSFDTMAHDGCLYIGTEVANESVEKTRDEIFAEMDKLCREPVSEDELYMVKNYLLGNLLTMIDGPFNASDVIKTLLSEGVPLAHFDQMGAYIRHVSAAEIQKLARHYLRPEDMWEVVVGP